MKIDCETETASAYPQSLRVRAHTFRADVMESSGGTDSAPGPHDYFDSALASCKALTAMWYAKRQGFPLERVEVHMESDASEERQGRYVFRLRIGFHGPLTNEQTAKLHAAVAACPIHKLMTTADVVIEAAAM